MWSGLILQFSSSCSLMKPPFQSSPLGHETSPVKSAITTSSFSGSILLKPTSQSWHSGALPPSDVFSAWFRSTVLYWHLSFLTVAHSQRPLLVLILLISSCWDASSTPRAPFRLCLHSFLKWSQYSQSFKYHPNFYLHFGIFTLKFKLIYI